MVLMCLVLLAVGMAYAAGQADSAVERKEYKLRVAIVGGPETPQTKSMVQFKEEIEKTTNGQIKVEVHHSGSLFEAAQLLPAIMRDNLEMAISSHASLAEFAPYMAMFTAGYLFTDYNHMVRVMGSQTGVDFYNRVAKETGIRPLSTFYLGARHINLRSSAGVTKPEDMRGVKLRMPSTEAYMFMGKALGANPTPLAFGEIYMALSSGTVDGQDNPLPSTNTSKFYEVTKSISLTSHYISSVVPVISEKIWQSFSDDLKVKVLAAIEKSRIYNDGEILKEEERLIDFFKEKGLNIVQPDLEAFSSHVRRAYLENKQLTASWDMELFNRIISMK
jgi:tripartite ATP-independent transporter DctP family solute receptor